MNLFKNNLYSSSIIHIPQNFSSSACGQSWKPSHWACEIKQKPSPQLNSSLVHMPKTNHHNEIYTISQSALDII